MVLGIFLVAGCLAVSKLLNASDMPFLESTMGAQGNAILIASCWSCSFRSLFSSGGGLLFSLVLEPSFLHYTL